MTEPRTLDELERHLPFSRRHIGPAPDDEAKMLASLGYASLDDLIADAVPASIAGGGALQLPAARSEEEALADLRRVASANTVVTSMIGLGYYGTHTPPVIRRNILESPAWYTAYTPYQPEISQGRLEALLNFQTMVADLTGLALANASLLDEATAAAEALTMARRASKAPPAPRSSSTPTRTRRPSPSSRPAPSRSGCRWSSPTWAQGCPRATCFGAAALVPVVDRGRHRPAGTRRRGPRPGRAWWWPPPTCSRSPCSPRPATLGADVAIGSSQRFGVPLGFGGPHAGFMAVRTGLERSLPGRLVGASQRRRRSGRATASRCRPVSSTSAARRPRRTSAPRRCCSPSSPACTRCTTAPTASRPSPSASTA